MRHTCVESIKKEGKRAMKRNNFYIFCGAISLAFYIFACTGTTSNTPVGGPCTYNDIPGTATIISNTTPTNSNSCFNNPVEVVYNFTPTDPNAVNNYRFSNWPDTSQIFLIYGLNPSSSCAASQNLITGSTHSAIRKEGLTGGCTPVVFEITDVNITQCYSTCN